MHLHTRTLARSLALTDEPPSEFVQLSAKAYAPNVCEPLCVGCRTRDKYRRLQPRAQNHSGNCSVTTRFVLARLNCLHANTSGDGRRTRARHAHLLVVANHSSQHISFQWSSEPLKKTMTSILALDYTKETNKQPIKSSSKEQPARTIGMLKKLLLIIGVLLLTAHVSAFWSKSIDRYLCHLRECCHANDGTGYIKYERGVDKLLDNFNSKVYGQPLIIKPIYKSLRAHVTDEAPKRPLVMYFAGWTGTGKTYVAKMIADNLFKEGTKSRFYRYISSSYHFPVSIHESQVLKYRQKLLDMIRETVSQCERSLIVLDELDKLPAGVVDGLQPLLDYVEDIDGVQYNKAVFIFLSNTGADSLNKFAYKMYTEGKERHEISSRDVEETLILDSYNEQGGLRQSALIRRYSIGVFVPFLPLQRDHVKMCVKDEIVNQRVETHDEDALIEEIADEMTYFPPDTMLYSKAGCKGVREKVVNYAGPPIHEKQPQVISYPSNQEL